MSVSAEVLTSAPELVELQKQLATIELRLKSLEEQMPLDRLSIVVSHNDFEHLMMSLILASGAVSMDMEAHLFFTFWGLTALKKKSSYEGKNFVEKMMTFMLPSHIRDAKLSKMHMMGIGKMMFEGLIEKHNIVSLPELLSLCINTGVRITACEMTMSLLGLKRDELIDGIYYGGVATYFDSAQNSRITLFM
jgi:peroxiredoxin family protein